MAAPPSERVRVRRGPRKGRYDGDSVRAVLDAGLVAHVAVVADGQPLCLPMLYARVGDEVLIHGSQKSRLMRSLAGGAPACVTVTVIRELVLARSAFEHSANYECAIAFGSFASVDDPGAKLVALEAFTEKLVRGRWREVQPPDANEVRATCVLSLRLDEASVKVRSGPPDDDDAPDTGPDVWAGVIPIETRFGTPQPSPGLARGTALSPSVERLRAGVEAAGLWPH
jgi:uncharacterized protein